MARADATTIRHIIEPPQSMALSLPARPAVRFPSNKQWLAIYGVCLVLGFPSVFGPFLWHGLEFDGHDAGRALLLLFFWPLLFAALAGVAAAPCLLLIERPRARAVGAAALVVNLVAMAGVTYWMLVEPGYQYLRLRLAASHLSLVSQSEEVALIDGRPAGLKLKLEFRLSRDMPAERFGSAAMQVLSGMEVELAEGPAHSRQRLPFSLRLREAAPSFDGVDIRTWSIFSRGSPPAVPGGPAAFPRGTYSVERTFWFKGLEADREDAVPCRREAQLRPDEEQELQQADGQRLRARTTVYLDVGHHRRGHDFSIATEPLGFVFDANQWKQDLPTLSVETCDNRVKRRRMQALVAQRAPYEQAYDEGSPELRAEHNPLFQEICGGELEAVAARLAKGLPKMNIAETIRKCTLTQPNDAMFELMLPALHAREAEREAYCSTVRSFIGKRDLKHLQQIRKLGLPLLCGERQDWDVVLCPSERFCSNKNVEGLPFEPLLPWLKLLKDYGAALCRTGADGTNLLQNAAAVADPASIEYLLAEGCDPQVLPELVGSRVGEVGGNYSAAFQWHYRSPPDIGEDSGVWTSEVKARLSARIGDVSARELNRLHPGTGDREAVTALGAIGRQIIERPEFLRYLASRGARLDAAGKTGYSWLTHGYTWNGHGSVEIRIMADALDTLSVDQLKVILKPIILSTGQPGRPLTAAGYMDPGELGAYLCQRGAVPCKTTP